MRTVIFSMFFVLFLFTADCFGQMCLVRCEPQPAKGFGGPCGSGFFISPNTILTANHVIEDSENVRVEFNNQYYVAEVVKTNKNKDLALLKIDKDQDKYYNISETEPINGEELVCKGFPRAVWVLHKSVGKMKESRWAWITGSKKDQGSNQYSVWMNVEQGMSGGPLLNKDDEALGVLSTKNADGQTIANFVSLNEIREFLNLSKVK
jgi:S1-C subfamily serine protease